MSFGKKKNNTNISVLFKIRQSSRKIRSRDTHCRANQACTKLSAVVERTKSQKLTAENLLWTEANNKIIGKGFSTSRQRHEVLIEKHQELLLEK